MPSNDTKRQECCVEGCDRVPDSRGMCQAHYLRWRKDGDTRPDVPIREFVPVNGECLVDDCDRRRFAKGYCGMHYNRFIRHGDPLAGGRARKSNDGPCFADGCDRLATCRGLCSMHYGRLVRHGDITRGRPEPKGSIHSSGYRYVSSPDHPNASKHGKIAEHRLIMSEHLGRPLLPDENVHHVNGDKLDNRIENLELWTTSQPKGQRVVDKIAWAKDLIERYEAF